MVPGIIDNMEIWKDIPEYEHTYQVSNLGRVRRLSGSYKCHKDRILKPGIKNTGYKIVSLWKNNKQRMHRVCKLVLETFIGPCPDGMECRHLDGNSGNDILTNLKYGTKQENINDKFLHGTTIKGSMVWNSKLKETDIPKIKDLIRLGFSDSEIGKIFNVNYATIYDIRKNKTWKHV